MTSNAAARVSVGQGGCSGSRPRTLGPRSSAIGGPQHDRRASLGYHQILDGRAARQGAHSEKGATEMALQVRAYNMTCVMNPAMKVPR
ncbi:MAG: hypothetical protein ABJQ70_07635 [Roseobacter sp.]